MYISSIFYYPVKSLAGISLPEATIDHFGIKGDRRWMIVDESGRFITQRQYTQLCLVRAELFSDGELGLVFPDGECVRTYPNSKEVVEVVVWSDKCRALASSNVALDKRLSDYLGEPARLVFMSEDEFRQVDKAFFASKQRVSFADGFPLLLLSETSMTDLNSRLQEKVGVERFRPNLVVEGASEAFAEDSWRKIRVGEVEFSVVKPCSRCVMTTVDPLSGGKGREPLMTLSRYRKQEGGVMFGQNIVQLNDGKIAVGDGVIVVE